MIAAIYARISQDRQADQLGINRQLQDCRREAASRGWEAVEFVDDDISAYQGKHRPGYESMMQAILNREVGAVIVWDLDRLTRRPIELEQFYLACAGVGLNDLITLHGSVDLGTGNGLFIARVKAAFAAEESQKKSERGKRKMLELAEAGKPHGGGTRPFGLNPDRMTLNEVEADAIRTMAARLLAGESLASIVKWIDASGIPTPTGAQWRTPTVRDILKGPHIAGLRLHQGQVIGKAAWPPIITEEQHAQIVALLEDPARRTNRTARRYLLTGIARCGLCGSKLVSNPKRGRRRYMCKLGPDFRGCGKVAMGSEAVEEFVAEAVIQRLDGPELREAMEGRTRSDEATRALSEGIAADEARIEELATAYALGQIPMKDWIKAGDVLRANVEAKRRELAQRSGSQVLSGLIGAGSGLRESWADLNLDRQRAIVSTIVDHVLIHRATRPGSHRPELSRIEIRWRL